MEQPKNNPPKWALSFFHWYCHPTFREEIEGDLLERFHVNYQKHELKKARNQFVKDVFLLFRPSIIKNSNHTKNTTIMTTTKQNKRLISILITAGVLLLIPLIAMNFSTEVDWKIIDFIIAAVLLFSTGLGLELILRKVKTNKARILFGLVLFLIVFLIWAELAVGIFGTPFAGS